MPKVKSNPLLEEVFGEDINVEKIMLDPALFDEFLKWLDARDPKPKKDKSKFEVPCTGCAFYRPETTKLHCSIVSIDCMNSTNKHMWTDPKTLPELPSGRQLAVPPINGIKYDKV